MISMTCLRTYLFSSNVHKARFLRRRPKENIVINKFRKLCCYTMRPEISPSHESAVKYLESPTVSENDPKLYKTFMLKNGLRVLIVSDPSPKPHDGLTSSSSSVDSTGDSCPEEHSASQSSAESSSSCSADSDEYEEGDEKLAAVALLVDVGSFSEPKTHQGLAHFLEHMIFMGSEKYPVENAFDAHIKKCGGFDNANTECEETLFYFEVSEEHLDSSMDYFSALLKAPLLKKEAMTREREAVESEFQQTLHDDEARRDQLLASLATGGYPQGTFAWGNIKSLKESTNDDELHESLNEFCRRHYTGNRMHLCIQARLPIDELEHLAVKHFSDIPSNQLGRPSFKEFDYRKAFRPEFFDNVYFVKPVDNVSKLELTWVFPSVHKYYRCKPDAFLSFFFGHEGEGSLCAYLRKRLWALDLIAGVDDGGFDKNSMYSLFNICIILTQTGFENLDDVLAATFAYVKLFNETSSLDSLENSYKEIQSIELNNFRFSPQRPAFDNVQSLVVQTKYYPPKDILTGADLYFEFNKDQISELIKILNEFHFNIMVISKQKYEGVVYDKKEKWFGTEYTDMPIPDRWRKLWNESKPIDELFLPKPNRFIANDFRILWKENGKPEISSVPKRYEMQTDTCELWFRQDDKFLLPEASIYFNLLSPLIRQNAKNDTLCVLYTQLIKFRLSEELYDATVAGINYQIYPSERGIVIKVTGFNEKQPLLVNIITKAMVSLRDHISEDELNAHIVNQKKLYFNALIKPKTLNKDIRLTIVENKRWPMIDKYKCLNSLTLKDMKEFADKFPKELYIQALMQGNLTEEIAHNVMNSVVTMLGCQKIIETQYIENRTVQLPQGNHFIRCHALNEKDANTYICNFYQIGPYSVRIESILDLLMMFVEEPLFDMLRTKEQLGYYVSACVRINYGIAGYSITINSQETKFSAAHVEERIEAFRASMLEILTNMDDDEFNHVRNSLIKIKQVVDMSLSEEVNRNWGEIACEEYLFDRRRHEVSTLRQLTKQEIIDFCLNNERTNLRKLSVQVIGNKVKRKENGTRPNRSTSNTSSSSSESDDDDNDELFNVLADKLDLKFIPRDGDAATITDINDFKENLYVYPITKTRLDDSPVDLEPSPKIAMSTELSKKIE